MPDTFTLHYNFTQPEVGASRDVWGGKDNANWANLDAYLWNIASTKFEKTGGQVSGYTNFTADTAFTSSTVTGQWNFNGPIPKIGLSDIVTKVSLAAFINAYEPIGVVKMWYGALGSIPVGWALCNTSGGSPNMTDRFILGAGQSYGLGAAGGAPNHNHGGVTGGHALAVAELAFHSHTINDPTHAHSINDPSHSHVYAAPQPGSPGAAPGGNQATSAVNANTSGSYTGISIFGAATGISLNPTGDGVPHSHPISVDAHLPPYYAIYFIYKYANVVIS